MAPETRSRGIPPPSRIYHSTPPLRQTHFKTSSRAKSVKVPSSETSALDRLRQQTLTQLDFVSSPSSNLDWEELGELDPEEEGDSEAARNMARNRENVKPVDGEGGVGEMSSGKKRRGVSTYGKKTKRRRTAGDEIAKPEEMEDEEDEEYVEGRKSKKGKGKGKRRKTLGDTPNVKDSKYHTQTLTQFLGKEDEPIVLDSEDELEEPDNEFDQWLSKAGEGSPTKGKEVVTKSKRGGRLAKTVLEDEDEVREASMKQTREESLVPQTPTKPKKVEIPSSSQAGTPFSTSKELRSLIDAQPSPSPLRTIKLNATAGQTPLANPTPRRKLVVEDSTETFALPDTPSKNSVISTTSNKENETPKSARSVRFAEPVGDAQTTPTRAHRGASQELGKSTVKKVRISSRTPERVGGRRSPGRVRRSPLKSLAGEGKMEIADSEDEGEEESWGDYGDGSWEPEILEDGDEGEEEDDGGFEVGVDTQAVLRELAEDDGSPTPTKRRPGRGKVSTPDKAGKTTTLSPPVEVAAAKKPSPQSVDEALPPPPAPKPTRLRKPLSRPLPIPVATQLMESQRIPQHLLQAFPQPGINTDLVLPLSSEQQDNLAGGYTITITTTFALPHSAVRAWLWDGEQIRYGISVNAKEGRKVGKGAWEYDVPQMYELNDPWDKQSMLDADLPLHIPRYRSLPPGLASGMMWNLQRALFMEEALGVYAQELGELESSQLAPSSPPANAPAPALEEEDTTETENPASGAKPSQTDPITVSQEVHRQLQSDAEHSSHFPTSDTTKYTSPTTHQQDQEEDDLLLVPSTPDGEASSIEETPRKPKTPSIIRPSQATTASQASTPDRPTSSPSKFPPPALPPQPRSITTTSESSLSSLSSLPPSTTITPHQDSLNNPAHPRHPPTLPASSSSLHFQDYPEPSPLPGTMSMGTGSVVYAAGEESSPFLGRSQMLPDSLLERDVMRFEEEEEK